MERIPKILIGIAVLAAATLLCILLDLSWVDATHSYTFAEVIDTLFGGAPGDRA